MKKAFALTLLAAILLGACEKEGHKTVVSEPSANSIVQLPNNGKKESSTFLLSMEVGHSVKRAKCKITTRGLLY